jgi:hypothetical protein
VNSETVKPVLGINVDVVVVRPHVSSPNLLKEFLLNLIPGVYARKCSEHFIQFRINTLQLLPYMKLKLNLKLILKWVLAAETGTWAIYLILHVLF